MGQMVHWTAGEEELVEKYPEKKYHWEIYSGHIVYT